VSTRQPTPQGISALLRKAGFQRSERTGRMGYSSGFAVSKSYGTEGSVRVRYTTWSMGGGQEIRLRQLAKYVPVIEAAGWSVRYADRIAELIVTVPESTEGEG